MSESIQEIPLEIAEEVHEIVEDIAETKAGEESEPVALEEVKPVMKPKAKGRPKGSRNLQPSKPRAKKTQIQEAPVDEAYEPPSPKRNPKLPTDPTTSDVAAAMLKLLQDQSCSRQSRKQRLYNSWFQ